jgi:hypothetical protein
MTNKKSIFINEESFEIVDEEVLEIEASDLGYDPVEFPVYVKPGTEEMIRELTGKPAPVHYHTLPDVFMEPGKDERAYRPENLATLKNCPRCSTLMKSAIAITGSESMSFKECPACGTLINTFQPIKYQAEVAARPERYILLAGGFGSGKSRINIEKVISHLILIPNARVVVAARTYPAIEATFVKDFFSIMPKRLLRKKNEMKHEWVFTNGSELILRSFDDPMKLRGINATMFVLLEASNIMYEGFELAQNRIRNTAALIPEYDSLGNAVMKYDKKARAMRPVYKYDARRILVETNPDAGWVKKKFLVDSATVSYYGSAYREGYRMNAKTDPNKFALVMATDANPYLPENFIAEQTRGKSPAYVQQFFYGSFNFSDNLIYPNVGACIVAPHPLPHMFDEQGKRALWYVIGLDYGISDALAIIYGAYSSITKKLYFFDELYEHNLDVKTAVKMHRDKMKLNKINNQQLMMLPLFDGRSYNKREANLQTIGSLFNAEGLYFTPSFTYNDARIAKFNGIINEGQIEIYSNLEFYIEEVTNYKWKVNRDGSQSDKPVDKNNHAINAGEFIVMALPLNLNYVDMTAYLPPGTRHLHDTEEGKSNEDIQTQVFNPYQGGRNNGRSVTHNTNNRYVGRGRPASNHVVAKQGEEEGNLFQAYVPRRTK